MYFNNTWCEHGPSRQRIIPWTADCRDGFRPHAQVVYTGRSLRHTGAWTVGDPGEPCPHGVLSFSLIRSLDDSKNEKLIYLFHWNLLVSLTFGQSWDGHNLVILHPIWTFDPTKMISSSRRIDWWKDLSSISFRLDFCFLATFCHWWPPGPWWARV